MITGKLLLSWIRRPSEPYPLVGRFRSDSGKGMPLFQVASGAVWVVGLQTQALLWRLALHCVFLCVVCDVLVVDYCEAFGFCDYDCHC